MNEESTEGGGVGGIELVPVEVDGVQLGHVRVHQVGIFSNIFTSPIKPPGYSEITGESKNLGEPAHWCNRAKEW